MKHNNISLYNPLLNLVFSCERRHDLFSDFPIQLLPATHLKLSVHRIRDFACYIVRGLYSRTLLPQRPKTVVKQTLNIIWLLYPVISDVPSAPTAPLEIITVGHNIAMTSWGIPEWDGGAPLLGYNIAIRETTKTMWMEVGKVNAQTLKFNIKDLSEHHSYMVRVYARNEVGLSEPLESEEPFKVIPGEGTYFSILIKEAYLKSNHYD